MIKRIILGNSIPDKGQHTYTVMIPQLGGGCKTRELKVHELRINGRMYTRYIVDPIANPLLDEIVHARTEELREEIRRLRLELDESRHECQRHQRLEERAAKLFWLEEGNQIKYTHDHFDVLVDLRAASDDGLPAPQKGN